MKLEEEIFTKYHVDIEKLKDYGFIEKDDAYQYKEVFMDNFEAIVMIDKEGKVSGKIYDLTAECEYVNFRIESQVGEFVSNVRESYKSILNDIKNKCFEREYFIMDQSNRITKKIGELYQDSPEFPWKSYPEYAIFRNPHNEKWYGLIMNVDKSKLDKNCSGKVEAINVKLDSNKIKELLEQDGFYPAYHMNKKNWITLILDDTLKDEVVMECMKESHKFTETSSSWLIPANPNFYDMINCFANKNTIHWKEPSGVNIDDIVYIYVGAPYSAVFYQCQVVKVNIPYEYQDKNLSMKKVMEIKLLKTYSKEEYTLEKLKKYGVKAVRGPRHMPQELEKILNQ